MKIEFKEVTIRELADSYDDSGEDGVTGFGGRLDIRPPYQREFIYKEKQRDAVINTITNDFPLNVMYWSVRNDGNFEIIDGQQRTISICQYVESDFSFNNLYFHNLTSDQQDQILDYKLMIYQCTGTDSERLDWFRTINIAGEQLTPQELRNAVYAGAWVSDAKRYFSKNGCAAYQIGGDYLKGSSIRQEYLETVIRWRSKDQIEDFMAKRQNKGSAKPLFDYFRKVIEWVENTFPNYRNEMKGVEWGPLYDTFSKKRLNPKKLESEIANLMMDDDVTNRKGIYSYVLTREEKHLNIRAFTHNQKRQAYEKQKGICRICKKKFAFEDMEADHITPWHKGGKTDLKNCQMLCRDDNRSKSGK